MNTIKLNTIGEAPVKKVAGSGGNKYTYYDIRGLSEEDKLVAMDYAYVAKEIDGEVYYDCMGYKYRYDYINSIVAIGVDLSVRVGGPDGLFTIAEVSEGFFDNLPRITEEEFYTMPTQFTINNGETAYTYYYEEGMTWEEWVNSNYNIIGIVIERDYIRMNEGFVSSNDGVVRTYDTIVSGSYFVSYVD